ncbi:MAG: ParA family protein [Bacteroidales bacterium]|nr:ParA family protein [Bacteroidales bacterium]
MTRIIATVCHKGGVGKTTSAASLGGILASEGKRVLLVDLDPQMNLTRTFCSEEFGRTVYDAFKEKRNLPVVTIRKGLDVVPSSIDVSGLDNELASVIGRERILSKLLAPVSGSYDWVFIDCPAQLGLVTANALAAADAAFIPISCDKFSGDGLNQMFDFVVMVKDVNPRLGVAGIAVTRFRPRRIVDSRVAESLREGWGKLVFKTMIRENAAIVQAPLAGTDIWSYEPKSNGALDYKALLSELKARMKNWEQLSDNQKLYNTK